MPKTFEDPNPHISILDDPQTKKQIANLARHALDVADRMKMASPPSEEQAERERFAAMSNRAAEENPLYAAVRGSTNFLVLPLEPGGVKPLVDVSEATRDDRQLYEWWQTWPDANPGILLGRVGGVFAVQVDNLAAWVTWPRAGRGRTPTSGCRRPASSTRRSGRPGRRSARPRTACASTQAPARRRPLGRAARGDEHPRALGHPDPGPVPVAGRPGHGHRRPRPRPGAAGRHRPAARRGRRGRARLRRAGRRQRPRPPGQPGAPAARPGQGPGRPGRAGQGDGRPPRGAGSLAGPRPTAGQRGPPPLRARPRGPDLARHHPPALTPPCGPPLRWSSGRPAGPTRGRGSAR